MFARTTKLQLQPGKIAEFKRIFQEVIVPGLQRQMGFHSITLLTDDANDKVLGIGFWDSEANLIANETSGVYQTLLGNVRHLLMEPPVRETYAVSLQVEPV
jgi:heme-degrading monooxygenase HmoA